VPHEEREERRIDRVQVPLSQGTVSLPWDSRQELLYMLDMLARFRQRDSMADVRDAFEALGTSAPVQLTRPQKGALLEMIEQWSTQVRGGFEVLPDGLFELRNRLHDDLHDTDDE
jgi:hypothetical protein